MSESNSIKQGSLLLSEPFMEDHNFKRTVVYLAEHNDEGTIGFVLNKKLDITLPDAIDEIDHFKAPLFYGGPVEPETLHFLHDIKGIEGSLQVNPGVYWGGNFETIKVLMKNGDVTPKNFKFFLGYSGWDVGQLQDEMKTNSWIISGAEYDHIFKNEWESLWKDVLIKMGGRFKMMSNFPEDPQLN